MFDPQARRFIMLKRVLGTSGLGWANRLAADLEIRAPSLARKEGLVINRHEAE